jgi:hypothetical protein
MSVCGLCITDVLCIWYHMARAAGCLACRVYMRCCCRACLNVSLLLLLLLLRAAPAGDAGFTELAGHVLLLQWLLSACVAAAGAACSSCWWCRLH